MTKKAKNMERQKKRTSGLRMNKRSEQRGKADIQKGENVELEKEHTVSLSLKKKVKMEVVEKNVVFFEMTGKYVKGENEERTEKG